MYFLTMVFRAFNQNNFTYVQLQQTIKIMDVPLLTDDKLNW
jgi:hypothetical protein